MVSRRVARHKQDLVKGGVHKRALVRRSKGEKERKKERTSNGTD